MNFGRKSTEGWSIDYVLLDILGGFTNFAQMVVQSIDQGEFFQLPTPKAFVFRI